MLTSAKVRRIRRPYRVRTLPTASRSPRHCRSTWARPPSGHGGPSCSRHTGVSAVIRRIVGIDALQNAEALRQPVPELIEPAGDVDIAPAVVRPGIEQLAVEVAGAELIGRHMQHDATAGAQDLGLVVRKGRVVAGDQDRPQRRGGKALEDDDARPGQRMKRIAGRRLEVVAGPEEVVSRHCTDLAEIADAAGFASLDEGRRTARPGVGRAERRLGLEMPRLLRGCCRDYEGRDQNASRKGRLCRNTG